MKEGIYFNMPEDDYHNLPYFSNSGANLVNIDPYEYWYYSSMNPDRPEREETDSMVFGKAMHSMLLEPEIFNKLYVTQPHPEDLFGKKVLITVDDLKLELESASLPKSGNKADLIERLRPHLDHKLIAIWDDVMRSFMQDVRENGYRILGRKEHKELKDMQKMVDHYPRIKEIVTGGYAEVVIIWRDEKTEVMCKARLDYLRPEAIGDVKTFSLKGKKNIKKAICDSIVYERYNMQYVIYCEAVTQIVKKLRSGKAVVEGDVPQEWMNNFLSTAEKRFFFIFIRNQAPYQCHAPEMQRYGSGEGAGRQTNVYYSEGEQLFRIAINIYAEYLKKYGNKPWINEKDVSILTDEEVPAVMYQTYAS